jgi:hypothetical protein
MPIKKKKKVREPEFEPELKRHPDPLDDEPEEGDEEEEDLQPERGKPFGQKFSQWRANLSDDVQKISIYVYKVEGGGPNKIPKKVQAYAFTIPKDADPPETHDIGVIVGSGEFDIIARTNGSEIMRKHICFGPVYDELKEERRAQMRGNVQAAQPQAAPAQTMVSPVDPFAGLVSAIKALAPVLSPILGSFAASMNPMENIRRMNTMGEEMAQKAFDFKMKVGAQAARDAYQEDDSESEPRGAVTDSMRSNWQEKLSDLADLLVWKGREYLQATGEKSQKMGDTVKRKVLNDEAFQSLLQNPEEFKKAYSQLCKDCAEIGGANTVGAILKKLGINPPVVLKDKSAKQKQAA